jgi:predicted peptidase
MQQNSHFQRTIHKQVELNYLLHTPPGTGRHPLIVFLHGHGESGADLELVKVHGIPRVVEEQPDFPFVTVSPQCPLGVTWVLIADAVEALVEETITWENVDPSRVYLTGLSMGGYGTWHVGVERPNVFAALAPLGGGGSFVKSLPRVCPASRIRRSGRFTGQTIPPFRLPSSKS